MDSYEQWQDFERQVRDIMLAARSDLLRLYEDCPVSPRLKAMAKRLAERDGGTPDELVMGLEGSHPMVMGNKKAVCFIQVPVRPLWYWYLHEAQAAIHLVEEFPDNGSTPLAEPATTRGSIL